MGSLFGTDGVRGVANVDLTPDLVLALGRAAGLVLAPQGGEVVIGRDTRLSGPMLEAALVAGLCSAGADVRLAGIIPTPGVAFLTLDEKAPAGAVISASHNPVPDNGIKFFSDDGTKIDGALADAIEVTMASELEGLPAGAEVGGARPLDDATERYTSHLVATLQAPLDGCKVVLDCAYGAAWEVGPEAFRRAGAQVVALHAEPDGSRINVDCGSTSLDKLAAAVVAEGADLGLAFDGDADRVLAVDETGAAVDGDRIIGLIALTMKQEGVLTNDLVVTTVMSNLGFIRALQERSIEVLTAQVGDRFVAEMMAAQGAALGGEQSGHVILAAHSTTGDGILTGLQLTHALVAAGARLSEVAHFYEPFPQVLINVPVTRRDRLDDAEEVWAKVAEAEAALGEDGRVLLRPSGTEPVIRVMVEAADEALARATATSLADVVKTL